ncbi:two-component system sensor histidine kinase NtrB [Nitrosopumilus sp.]|uniref:two-component system sensor histidine kinase NtrB n=1 Tax=Nitrosopumilus sp. TaxID=2024843 RepID=UPI003D0BC068
MKTTHKITLLVSVQIALIIASFLTLSFLESERNNLEDSIEITNQLRHHLDILIFEVDTHLNKIPYADPHSEIKHIEIDLKILNEGGVTHNLSLEPLPKKFQNSWNVANQKITEYTNELEKSIKEENLQIDFANEQFINLETKRFDANGSVDYLISTMTEESRSQSKNLIVLQVGLAILNVGIHIMMIFLILDILRRQAERDKKIEKFATIGELASRFAHDLRNPLAVIRGATELMKNDLSGKDEKLDKRFRMIDTAIARMIHQVEDILDFVRTKEIRKEEKLISEIIKSALEKSNIPDSVKVNILGQDCKIKCDGVKIEIAVINLISNSVDAVKNSGEINITTKKMNNFLEIQIEDSGPGIPSDKIAEIFEPLFTLKQKGTGLGLTSCQNIIKQHDGAITVKNNPTTFTIKLPIDS